MTEMTAGGRARKCRGELFRCLPLAIMGDPFSETTTKTMDEIIAAAIRAAERAAYERAARLVEVRDEGYLGLIDSQAAADAIRGLAQGAADEAKG